MVNQKFAGRAGALLLLVSLGLAAPAQAAMAWANSSAASLDAEAPSPHRFVDVAASAALYAVEAGKLAEKRARSSKVRSLAKQQKDNGFGIGGQLSWAGRRVNALPDNVLTRDHQRMLDALRTTRNFDATYLAQQQQLVPVMRLFHENYARRGGSATLRPVAMFGARKMAAQEAALRSMN